MKTRIRDAIRDDGRQVYICEYKWLFWWRPCNTYLTHWPRGSCRNGYLYRADAESRIKDFLNGVP